MKRIMGFLPIILCLGCETTAPSLVNINPRIADFQIRRVAILPFEGVQVEKGTEEFYGWWKHNVMNNGESLSDIFTTEMMKLPLFDYVERSQIRKILEEKKLSITDLMRDKSVSDIGKLLGVDAVIVGKVNQLDAWVNTWGMSGCTVSFSTRMVDTNTGTVLWSTSVDRHEGGTFTLKLAQDECAKIVKELKAKLQPETPAPPAEGKK
jgi:curli biogenesis system outer membrane secretion channel CsgG